MKKIQEFDKNPHSVYKLNYHLVLVTKYRKKVITSAVFDTLSQALHTLAAYYKIEIIELNWDIDHVHLLFSAQPTTNISKFIASYKAYSSRLVRNKHLQVIRKLYGDHFWSPSYCILNCGSAPIEIIKEYIEKQRA